MRIALSGMFWAQPHVGSGQYLHHLVTAIGQQSSDNRFVLVVPRYTLAERPNLRGWQVIIMPTPFDKRSRNLAKLWFEQIAFPQICRRLRVTVARIAADRLQFRRPCVVIKQKMVVGKCVFAQHWHIATGHTQ